MKSLIQFALSISILSVVSSARAAEGLAPALFTACPQAKKIIAPKNGAGVFFSSDCSVAYVLPPLYGRIEMAQPSATSNTRVCSSVNNVFNAIEASSDKINYLIRQIKEEEKKIKFDDLADPWLSGGNSNQPPPDLNPQLEKLEKLRADAADSVNKVLKFNEQLAEYEGPKVRVTVLADQDSLVREYQRLNPKVLFRAMPLQKSVLTFVGRVDKNIGKAPAALYVDLGGVRIKGENLTGIKPGQEHLDNGAQEILIQFHSAVSGQIVLSLLGACPLLNPVTGVFPDVIPASKMTSHIAPSVDYVYAVEVNRSYEASYNLSELFKRIQRQSTKGGFFSTSTMHSLVVETNTDGWFKFRSLSQDPHHEWDTQLAQTVKAEIISRLLQRLGARPIGEIDAPSIITPGKNGADSAANAIKQCPHVYCQAAGYALDFLNATFGGSNAVSEFIRTNDHWEREVVEEKKMVPFLGQVAFGRE